MSELPLVVDMDGTLLEVETQDVMLTALRRRPHRLLLARAIRRMRGKAAFKRYLVAHSGVRAADLPRRAALVEWLSARAAAGAQIYIASGSPIGFVEDVRRDHPGIFAGAFGTEGDVNLTGHAKARLLAGRFGERGFDYAGNSWADLPVWAQARRAIICGPPGGLVDRVRDISEIERVFA